MKPRILIVDDEEAITRQLYWTLCEDYDVLTANDMQTAVRRATLYEPILAILDLYLSDSPEAGLRIIEYVKSHVPDSKVLVMISSGGIEMKKACYAAGADGFLDKPFDTELLLSTLHRLAPPVQIV